MTTSKQTPKGLIVVDDIDADLLQRAVVGSNGKWNIMYARTRLKSSDRATLFIHRAIMARALGRELTHDDRVDHIDNDTMNNTRSNLRVCTHAQNCANTNICKGNTSGYKGVGWHKATGKWRAYITVNKKQTQLGLFNNPKDAHAAYVKAAIKHFGEFANDGNGCLTLNEVKS